MNKLELMASMMGGGEAASTQSSDGVGITTYPADDLAVQLGLAKPNEPAIAVAISTAIYPKPKQTLRATVKGLQKGFDVCRFCGERDLVWLINESGNWRLFDADGRLHACPGGAKPMRFMPLVPQDDD